MPHTQKTIAAILKEMSLISSKSHCYHPLKKDQCAFIRELNEDDIEQSLTLQDIILEDLGPNQQTFIVPKTREAFLTLRDGIHGITLGAFVQDPETGQYQLIGQQILQLHTTPHHQTLQEGKIQFNGKTAEIGGLFVHKDFRGNGLSEKMQMILEDKAKEKGIPLLTAETHIENFFSQRIFFNRNFFSGNATFDPEDQAPVCYFFNPLDQQKIAFHPDDQLELPLYQVSIPNIQDLMKRGYYGTKYNQHTDNAITLSFAKYVIG